MAAAGLGTGRNKYVHRRIGFDRATDGRIECEPAVVGRTDLARAWELSEVRRRLRFLGDAPLLTVSAKTGAGVGRIFELARRLAAAVQREIGTAELNRWLSRTVALHDPAMAQRGPRRKPVKFYYATQMGTRPPTFVLFTNRAAPLHFSHERFLVNQLRRKFGFKGTPVVLKNKPRKSA